MIEPWIGLTIYNYYGVTMLVYVHMCSKLLSARKARTTLNRMSRALSWHNVSSNQKASSRASVLCKLRGKYMEKLFKEYPTQIIHKIKCNSFFYLFYFILNSRTCFLIKKRKKILLNSKECKRKVGVKKPRGRWDSDFSGGRCRKGGYLCC